MYSRSLKRFYPRRRSHRPRRRWSGLNRPRYRYNPYRRNLLPLSRRKELIEASPGNFRRPTLAATKAYLDDWASLGIHSADDWDAMDPYWEQYADEAEVEQFDNADIAAALTKNRYDEAQHYWRPYKSAYDLWESDPDSYKQPKFTQPVLGSVEAASEDFRDFGDYAPISKKQARNYLYQFLARNAARDARQRDDVREQPFKWRYREAVLLLGPDLVTQMVKDIFRREGKRAPKWYLPENLYDDLDDLFSDDADMEVAELEEEDAEMYGPWQQYGPWPQTPVEGPEPMAASPFRYRRRYHRNPWW